MKTNNGFSHVLLLVLLFAVLGIVGFAGWRVLDNQQATPSTATNQQASGGNMTSSQDISENVAELEQINIDEELNPASLDEDVSELQ